MKEKYEIPDGKGTDDSGKWEIEAVIPEGTEEIQPDAFVCCEELRRIVIPDGVKAIRASAICECKRLRELYIPASVTQIEEQAFQSCRALEVIRVAPENPAYMEENGVLYTKDRTVLLRAPARGPHWFSVPEGVTRIADGAFEDCTALEGVKLPASVRTIGDEAFSGCGSLEDVQIAEGVRTVGSLAFGYCLSLKQLLLPDSIETIGARAFAACVKLEEIHLPVGLRQLQIQTFSGCQNLRYVNLNSLEELCVFAFEGCANLRRVALPAVFRQLHPGAFERCHKLKGLHIAADNPVYRDENGIVFRKDGSELVLFSSRQKKKYTIPEGVSKIGVGAFLGCHCLQELDLPDTLEEIGNCAIYDTGLLKLAIPERVSTIQISAFAFNDHLKELSFHPKSRLEVMPVRMCAHCRSLLHITIPEQVRWVEEQAFRDCRSLTWVIPENGKTQIDSDAFLNCPKVWFPMPRCFPNEEIRSRSLWYFCLMEGGDHAQQKQTEAYRAYISAHCRQLFGEAERNPLLLRYMVREKLISPENLKQVTGGPEECDQLVLPEFMEKETDQ